MKKNKKIELISDEKLKSLVQKTSKYAYRHKPTNTWVIFFANRRDSPIGLCLKPDATALHDKEELKQLLLQSSFNGIKNYCRDNFLEFELKKV